MIQDLIASVTCVLFHRKHYRYVLDNPYVADASCEKCGRTWIEDAE